MCILRSRFILRHLGHDINDCLSRWELLCGWHDDCKQLSRRELFAGVSGLVYFMCCWDFSAQRTFELVLKLQRWFTVRHIGLDLNDHLPRRQFLRGDRTCRCIGHVRRWTILGDLGVLMLELLNRLVPVIAGSRAVFVLHAR